MLPEWEDLGSTVRQPMPTAPSLDGAQSTRESSIQLAGTHAADAMGERQMELGLALVCLEHDVASLVVFDASARAALATLSARVAELCEVRDALDDLYALSPLFTAEAPLTAFVGGLYSWTDEVTRTLGEVVTGLRVFSPDWARVRNRIERAAEWYFDGLKAEIRAEVRGDGELAARVEQLLWAAALLDEGLRRRFG